MPLGCNIDVITAFLEACPTGPREMQHVEIHLHADDCRYISEAAGITLVLDDEYEV